MEIAGGAGSDMRSRQRLQILGLLHRESNASPSESESEQSF